MLNTLTYCFSNRFYTLYFFIFSLIGIVIYTY
nr:MAG TPA: hypothetical protein [Bacteriophage sp.]